VVSHTVVHIESAFAHDQPWEEQNTYHFLLFVCLGYIHCTHIFSLQYWWDMNTKSPKPCTNTYYCSWLPSFIQELWII